jgi:YfiH family protein
MNVVDSAVGRIVIPPSLPLGFALFYTTRDLPGRLDDQTVFDLMGVVRHHFGIEATLTTCTQVHGATVHRAAPAGAWLECSSCDALWSSEMHSALGIKVADCLPVTMIDPAHSVIANVHSGWRGVVQRITSETIFAIERETAFDPRASVAYLGPSIRVCCFEVGEEVVDQLALRHGDGTRYVDRTKSRPHVDLVAMTADVLRSAGFADDAIHDSGLCTRCEGSMFHSYRRDAKSGGRNLALVAQ